MQQNSNKKYMSHALESFLFLEKITNNSFLLKRYSIHAKGGVNTFGFRIQYPDLTDNLLPK
jgi:hypothetical protein